MSRRLCVGAIATVLLGGLAYMHTTYLFNPLTFQNDEVLHLPWSWYRAPLQIEYGVLEDGGWKFVRLNSPREIKQVFSELQRAERSEADVAERPEAGRLVWFGVRRTKDNVVLLNVRGNEGSPDFLLGGNTRVRLTPTLQELLQDRLSLTNTIAAK